MIRDKRYIIILILLVEASDFQKLYTYFLSSKYKILSRDHSIIALRNHIIGSDFQ
jgi:hypothetical protein